MNKIQDLKNDHNCEEWPKSKRDKLRMRKLEELQEKAEAYGYLVKARCDEGIHPELFSGELPTLSDKEINYCIAYRARGKARYDNASYLVLKFLENICDQTEKELEPQNLETVKPWKTMIDLNIGQ